MVYNALPLKTPKSAPVVEQRQIVLLQQESTHTLGKRGVFQEDFFSMCWTLWGSFKEAGAVL